MSARKRKRQKSGGGALINSVSAIVILVAVVLGISVFFRVSEIEVSGASRYSSAEIIEASGVKEGSSLIFLNRASIESKIMDTLVYVGRASVSRRLPNAIVIEVRESGTVACVETDSGLWLIDNFCRLLEPCPSSESGSFISIVGFSAVSPKAGERIGVSDEDKSKVEYLEALLMALDGADMLSGVSRIDMSTSGNPQFEYLGRFRVRLGGNESLEAKLALLEDAIPELDEAETGVFDLSNLAKSQSAHFSPD